MTATSSSVPSPGRLRTYASFVRLEHTLFSLPLILAGVFCVPAPAMGAWRWVLTAIAAVGARTAAMSLNRLIDRRLDAANPRTRVRELPSGRMKTAEAVALLVGSAIAYVGACAALGRWYLEIAPIPLALFALYPYLKRFTPLCHLGVGAALALSPLAGYAVAHPELARTGPAWALAAFAFVWVSGFDIIYATLDEASDRVNGVHSMVVWLGRERALRVSWAMHLGAGAAMAIAWRLVIGSVAAAFAPWGIASVVCLLAVAALLSNEQRLAENVDLAFFKINVWVGAVVLATILAARMASGGL
jgi:4-hydroxybenzoate polyprenyltransferase